MSFQYQGFEAATGIEPERALNFGLGVAQAPLWMAFYASAGLGAAWWWSTAWTRAVPSLDFARLAAPEATPAVEAFIPAPEAAADEVIEAASDEAAEVVEAAETFEADIEIAGETAVESVSYTVEQVEAAIAETTDVTPEAPAPVEAVAEPVVELAEKAPKKKAPKAE